MSDYTEEDLSELDLVVEQMIAGNHSNFSPVTDEDQIDQAEDRDIVTRIFERLSDGSYWRVIWAYVYAPGENTDPTMEPLDMFEVTPVERTYTDWVEVTDDSEEETEE